MKRDMRRSVEDERCCWWSIENCGMKYRKNIKSGSTIPYLTLTPVQQGTMRKTTLRLESRALNLKCVTNQSIA